MSDFTTFSFTKIPYDLDALIDEEEYEGWDLPVVVGDLAALLLAVGTERDRLQNALTEIASYNDVELRLWEEDNAADMVLTARAALRGES